MKKYKITYICNDTVADISKKLSDDDIDEYVSDKMTPKSIEIFAYSADHAEYKFYKSFMSSISNNFIKILDVCEIPLNENDMNTYRICIDYIPDNLEKYSYRDVFHKDILVSATSPQQAELFVLRSFCNTDKRAIHVHAV